MCQTSPPPLPLLLASTQAQYSSQVQWGEEENHKRFWNVAPNDEILLLFLYRLLLQRAQYCILCSTMACGSKHNKRYDSTGLLSDTKKLNM